VELIKKHKVERAFFTGHSLGGGLANVAHLFVRGQLKKAGSPWAELEGKLDWTACTFAAPQTIVRLYEAENKPPPPLVVDLDASSYNVVYGCDPVPRLPGMLKYMGDLVEKAVPKIFENIENEVVNKGGEKAGEYVGLAGRLAASFAASIAFAGANRMFNLNLGGLFVRFLKDNGIAEVVRHYTHLGTVVYLAPGAQKYVQLTKDEIEKTLDVNGEAFDDLLGNESDWGSSLVNAHIDSCKTLMFKVK